MEKFNFLFRVLICFRILALNTYLTFLRSSSSVTRGCRWSNSFVFHNFNRSFFRFWQWSRSGTVMTRGFAKWILWTFEIELFSTSTWRWRRHSKRFSPLKFHTKDQNPPKKTPKKSHTVSWEENANKKRENYVTRFLIQNAYKSSQNGEISNIRHNI